MKTVERHFELDAGHRLANHSYKCQNLHGHRYIFDIEVKGEVSDYSGMLMDFSNIKKPIMEAFDHNTLLNEEDEIVGDKGVVEFIEEHQEKEIYLMDREPSVENIADESAKLIFEAMTEDERQRIESLSFEAYETPNCMVSCDYQVFENRVEDEEGLVLRRI